MFFFPTHNGEKVVKRTIRSIQNQSLKELEIVVVKNDASTDKTLSILEELQKEDPRIKIINNWKPKGVLNGWAVGVINSRAKYVFPIDSDNIYCSIDILETIYNEAEKNDIDTIGFKSIVNSEYDINLNKIQIHKWSQQTKIYLTQPKLSEYAYYKNISDYILFDDRFIWNKCIKKSLYMKAIDILGEEISRYHKWGEDQLIIFLLNKNAKNYKFIEKYGNLYYQNRAVSSSFTKSLDPQITVENWAFVIKIMFKFTDNT